MNASNSQFRNFACATATRTTKTVGRRKNKFLSPTADDATELPDYTVIRLNFPISQHSRTNNRRVAPHSTHFISEPVEICKTKNMSLILQLICQATGGIKISGNYQLIG